MAKVSGPLFSLSASGKLADAMVHFGWKGINVVRKWLKPAQPRPVAVMNLRLKMKALGKVSKAFSVTSTLRAAIIAKTPEHSIWNADWIGVAVKQFIVNNDAWDALNTLVAEATAIATWKSEASGLGLVDQTLTVNGKSADHPVTFPPQHALYLLATACWYRTVLDEGEVAYTDPHTWDVAAVTAFAGRIVD